jgi:hypothetical protein
VYNRNLKKHLKVFDNTQIIEIDPQRELYTRHGLHMNQNGKELMAKKNCTGSHIYAANKKIDPIVISENTHIDVLSKDYSTKTTPKHDNMEPSNTQKFKYNNDTSVTTRPKKPPNTMLKDFFMVDCPYIHTQGQPQKKHTQSSLRTLQKK